MVLCDATWGEKGMNYGLCVCVMFIHTIPHLIQKRELLQFEYSANWIQVLMVCLFKTVKRIVYIVKGTCNANG